ncbi:double-strand-break repair protein rad21-like protein 1 [Lampris incognitus]|uniref:double-strand-break repair protein rad21-like protein 1 n=1 Tax=Lampris incognitus TaxID=2546036 RepID=UPI0024B5D402|nr:double-strand-break repair protein rad21-like protein 1 [Lampris incognitus]
MFFYAQLFVSNRGPLAKIWLAAHWERKLTRIQVVECDLETSVQDIISPTITIGLRISGHLLLGVVRMYSRKAKYLLADCAEASGKIKLGFRPDQTDMPVEELEAPHKAITFNEDFTDFENQLPCQNEIDISMNQSRTEEITLKEDSGNCYLTLKKEPQYHQSGQLDMNLQGLEYHRDSFGDENTGYDLLDFISSTSDNAMSLHFNTEELLSEKPGMTNVNVHQNDPPSVDPMGVEPSTLDKTTLLTNAEECFTLDPVAVSPTLEKKGKRKRALVVDKMKELTNDVMIKQLSDTSDLAGYFEIAPPTRQLMYWQENGTVDILFAKSTSTFINPQLQQLFSKSIFRATSYGVAEDIEPEQMRKDKQEDQRDTINHTTEQLSILEEAEDPQKRRSNAKMSFDPMIDSQLESITEAAQSMLGSQEREEQRLTRQAHKLLNALKSNSSGSFSLKELCNIGSRSQAAATFSSFLVLTKQQALVLHQSKPYEDIRATPGPRFHELSNLENEFGA